MIEGLEQLAERREPESAGTTQFREDIAVGRPGQDFKKEAGINTTVIFQIP